MSCCLGAHPSITIFVSLVVYAMHTIYIVMEINLLVGVGCAFLWDTKKGWRLYDLEETKFFVSCDEKFVETVFPFAEYTTSIPVLSPSPANEGGFTVDETHASIWSDVTGVALRRPRMWARRSRRSQMRVSRAQVRAAVTKKRVDRALP